MMYLDYVIRTNCAKKPLYIVLIGEGVQGMEEEAQGWGVLKREVKRGKLFS